MQGIVKIYPESDVTPTSLFDPEAHYRPEGKQVEEVWIEVEDSSSESFREALLMSVDSLVGDDRLILESLSRRHPVPRAYAAYDVSRVMCATRRLYDVYHSKYRRQRDRLWLVLDTPWCDDEELVPVVAENCGPVLVSGKVSELREDFPAEDNLVVTTGQPLCSVRYDVKAAKRSLANRKAQVSRDALMLDELHYFAEQLTADVNCQITGNRWSSGLSVPSKGMHSNVLALQHILPRHNLLFGQNAYRKTRGYERFILRVIQTERATLKKWRDYSGFIEWLQRELRTAVARKLRGEVKRGDKIQIGWMQDDLESRLQDVFGNHGLIVQNKKPRRKRRRKLPEVYDLSVCELAWAEEMLR